MIPHMVGVQASASDPYFANVLWLLHFDARPYTDEKGRPVAETGTVALNSSDKAFGVASGQFGGAAYVRVSAGLVPGSYSVFTLEMWIKPTNLSAARNFFGAMGNNLALYHDASGRVGLYYAGSTYILGGLLSTSSWNYIAVVATGGNIYLQVNSTAVGSHAWAATYGAGDVNYVGTFTGSLNFIGLIDEGRFTANVARDVSAIPTAPFPNH